MEQRPNILLITTDQQRFDTLCAGGYSYMKTPNLDRLIHEGCNYTHAYSPNPVCLSARHNIISGLTARYHTFDDNYFDDSHQIPFQLPTFAQCLSDAGYDTIAIGKMHFQPYRRHNGFHRFYMMDEIPRFREDDDYAIYLKEKGYDDLQSVHGVRHLLYMQPQQSFVDEDDHGSSWVRKKTIEYLDTKSKNKPFLLWAGFIAPHPPFDVPPSFAHLYDDVEIPEPLVSKTPISTLAEENKAIGNYPDHKTLMRAKELYYASISFVDKQVGMILDKLEEMGELDNTCIIFTSDHGEMMGDMGTFQKFLPYDGSLRIPMIVRYPKKVKAGTVCHDFVDLNDLFPTILDVAGIPMPTCYDYPGASLFTQEKDRQYQYAEHQHGARRWVSLSTHHYKYNYYYGGGKEELFDLVNDPHETENLLHDEKKAKEMEEIRQLYRKILVQYEDRYGLEGCIENNDFKKYDDFEPVFYRECNPPFYPANLAKDREREKLMSLEEETARAIEHEEVDVHRLDLAYFTDRNVLNAERLDAEIAKLKNKS